MSLKDQTSFVKEALSGDEKILESAFKLEKLYKKHKFKIWGAGIALVLFFGGTAGIKAYNDSKLNSANDALLVLQQNPSDKSSLDTLKTNNPKLYELFLYSNALKNADSKALQTLVSSQDKIISDISKYHASIIDNKPTDSIYYQDFVVLLEAFNALKSGQKDIAKEQLSLIEETSPVAGIGKALGHYSIGAN